MLRNKFLITEFCLDISRSFLSRIALCGSEAQKRKYLPSSAQLHTVGCWVSVKFLFNMFSENQFGFLLIELYITGFDWAGLWKWCKLLENHCNKGLILKYYIDMLYQLIPDMIFYKVLANCFCSLCMQFELHSTCGLPIPVVEQVAGGWMIDGQKRWIGNSTFADVLVVFARNTSTNQING